MGYAHNQIESIQTNPSAISRNLFNYNATVPRWFLLLLATSALLSFALILPLSYTTQLKQAAKAAPPAQMATAAPPAQMATAASPAQMATAAEKAQAARYAYARAADAPWEKSSYPTYASTEANKFNDSASSEEPALSPSLRRNTNSERATDSSHRSNFWQNLTNNIPALMGLVFCTVSTLISVLVLMVSLPIFLLSTNIDQVKRAGGLVKTTLGFFVSSSAAILATITIIN